MNNSLTKFRLMYMEALAKSWGDVQFQSDMLQSDNLLEFFDAQFGSEMKTIWPLLEIKVSDEKKSVWDPQFYGGWIGDDGLLEITIPNKPEDAYAAEALAIYSNLFPTLMGDQKKDSKVSYGVSDENFLQFGALIPQIISLVWRGDNQEFLNEIYSADDQGELILSKYFKFKNPWGLRVKFKEAPDDKFTYNSATKAWDNIVKNKVTIFYSDCPDDVKDQAYSLASNNIDFDIYPYTCC